MELYTSNVFRIIKKSKLWAPLILSVSWCGISIRLVLDTWITTEIDFYGALTVLLPHCFSSAKHGTPEKFPLFFNETAVPHTFYGAAFQFQCTIWCYPINTWSINKKKCVYFYIMLDIDAQVPIEFICFDARYDKDVKIISKRFAIQILQIRWPMGRKYETLKAFFVIYLDDVGDNDDRLRNWCI